MRPGLPLSPVKRFSKRSKLGPGSPIKRFFNPWQLRPRAGSGVTPGGDRDLHRIMYVRVLALVGSAPVPSRLLSGREDIGDPHLLVMRCASRLDRSVAPAQSAIATRAVSCCEVRELAPLTHRRSGPQRPPIRRHRDPAASVRVRAVEPAAADRRVGWLETASPAALPPARSGRPGR